jgi:hypothetical protein
MTGVRGLQTPCELATDPPRTRNLYLLTFPKRTAHTFFWEILFFIASFLHHLLWTTSETNNKATDTNSITAETALTTGVTPSRIIE